MNQKIFLTQDSTTAPSTVNHATTTATTTVSNVAPVLGTARGDPSQCGPDRGGPIRLGKSPRHPNPTREYRNYHSLSNRRRVINVLKPLTENGVAQTRALGQSTHWASYTCGLHKDRPSAATSSTAASSPTFYRIYSSDLQRTRHTTQLLLDTKGVRQGYPKHWSYEQALDEYQKAAECSSANGNESFQTKLPLYETNQDGWKRALDWLQSVVDDIVAHEQTPPTNGMVTTISTTSTATAYYTVLVVAHAGLLRLVLQRLLGTSRLAAHATARFDPHDQGRLAVPNTSLTILDLHIDTIATLSPPPLQPLADPCTSNGQRIESEENLANGILPHSVQSIDIVLFTSTDHLHVA
jgi:broad specificity phosphatase PhoE